jgi:hypothetical protein
MEDRMARIKRAYIIPMEFLIWFVLMMQCSRERLFLALGFELFAVKDDKFMNMFVAPGAVDAIQNERESLLKRQKTFVSCLNEFKNISSTL